MSSTVLARFIVMGVCCVGSVLAQVQPNGPEATFLVNGVGGAGFAQRLPALIAIGQPASFEVGGLPNSPFLVVTGDRLEPGLSTGPSGVLNIGLGSASVLVDGFQPGGGFWNTGPTGVFSITGPPFPAIEGLSTTLQVVTAGTSGLLLTAPTRLISVPGMQIPASLNFRIIALPFSGDNRHALAGDWSGDGLPDIINSSAVWLGQPNFNYTVASIDPAGAEAGLANLVGSSHLDLVVLDNIFLGLKIYPGTGTGNFLSQTPIALQVSCDDDGDLALVDFDLDNDLDVVVATGLGVSPGVVRFQNVGNGIFLTFSQTFGEDSRTVATPDLNNDMKPEIVIDYWPTVGPPELRILWGNFAPGHTLTFSTVLNVMPEPGAMWVRAADLDNDGDQDLLWSGMNHHGVLINQGNMGSFVYRPLPGVPNTCCPAPSLEAGDIDDDGDQDVLFVDRQQANRAYLVVAVNDGTGNFTSSWYIPLEGSPTIPVGPSHIVVQDLDQDGDQDVMVGGYNVTLLINDN